MIKKKHILWTFLAFVALAMLTGIAAVLLPSGWVREEVLITIFIVGAYSLGGIVIVAVSPKSSKYKWTLRISSVSLATSMMISIIYLWLDPIMSSNWDDFGLKSMSITLIVGLAFAHRLMIVPLKVPLFAFHVVKRTALIAAGTITVIMVYGILTDFQAYWMADEVVGRIVAIGAIIATGSTIAAGAIAIFAPKPGDDEQGTLSASIEIPLDCPRCQSPLTARSNNESRCSTCKLKLRIEIEEPRCTCGYLLYELQSNTCPECGKHIPESEQWGSTAELTESNAVQSASDDPSQTPSS